MTCPRILIPLALWLAAAFATAQEPACAQLFAGGAAPAFSNPKLVQGAVMLCNDAFAVAACGITRGALWSAEHSTAASLQAAATCRVVASSTPTAAWPLAHAASWRTIAPPASIAAT